MELRFSTLQVELVAMQEKDKATNSLQEETKIHDSPSTPVAQVTKLEDALKEAEKQYPDAYDVVKEMTRQMDEHQKYFR